VLTPEGCRKSLVKNQLSNFSEKVENIDMGLEPRVVTRHSCFHALRVTLCATTHNVRVVLQNGY